MRVIGANTKNEMTIADSISGDEITLYFRTPSNSERQRYFADLWGRDGDNIKDNSQEARLNYGAEILMGIEDDEFGFKDADEKIKPFSSDPENKKNYRADWKELIKEHAPELVEFLALRVFEGLRQVPKAVKELRSKN